MAGDVLSQAEVESLLHALDSGARAQEPPPVKLRTHDKVSPYDFKRPERVGKDQTRSLQTLHEGFSRNFGAALSGMLRCIAEVKLSSVDELTYSEFIFSLENPTCFNLLRAEPLEGNLILDINPAILFPIIDRLLGGGKEATPPARRPLTEIELRLVRKITDKFLDELRRAWENVLPLKLAVDRVESNPQLVQIMPPNEVVVLISFELSLGESRGMMNLCLPFNSLERVSSRLTSNSWTSYGRKTFNEASVQQVTRNLHKARAAISVELARTQLNMGELLDLRVGDIITTETDCQSPLTVSVGDVPKFRASPGAYRGHKAIRIESSIAPEPEPPPKEL